MKPIIYENNPIHSSEHQDRPQYINHLVSQLATSVFAPANTRKVQRRPPAPPSTMSGLYTAARDQWARMWCVKLPAWLGHHLNPL